MARHSLACMALALVAILGCSQSADREAFRVKQSGVQPASPESKVPPLASHISSEGEVTTQVGPPNLPAPERSSDGNSSTGLMLPTEPGFTHSSPAAPPVPSATIRQETGTDIQVDLSAAVALPMTGPEGTMMGFSVDYRLKGAGAPSQSSYVWVIEGRPGKVYRLPVKLNVQGNLMFVIQDWRPEDGPFRCRIEDYSGRPVSPVVDMR